MHTFSFTERHVCSASVRSRLRLYDRKRTSSNFDKRNVIFQELDIVSTTSANWKTTFVSNILPFQAIIDQLYKSLGEVLLTTATVMHQYDEPKKQAFCNSFLGLRKEIEGIRVFQN